MKSTVLAGFAGLACYVAVHGLPRAGWADVAPIDLDGDSQADTVTVERGAVLVRTARGVLRWTDANVAADTRSQAVISNGNALLAVTTAHQAWVLQVQRGQLRLVTQSQIGAIDEDGELMQALDVLPQGIVRSQRRTDVTRCDGVPARLFPARWDAQRNAFVPAPGIDAPTPTHTVLASSSTTPPQGAVFTVRTESFRSDASDARFLAVPTELRDGNAATVWPPGPHQVLAAAKGGFVTALARWPNATASQLAVQLLHHDKKPSRLLVTTPSGTFALTIPAATPGLHTWTAPLQDGADCVSVFIDDLHAGISELAIVSASEQSGTIDTALVSAIVEDRNRSEALRILTARGAAGVTALRARLQSVTELRDRQRVLAALRQIDPAGAPQQSVPAIIAGDITGPDLDDALAALTTRGAHLDLFAIASAPNAADDVRRAAVIHLTTLGTVGAAALVSMLGQGSFATRHAIIAGAAQASRAELQAATQTLTPGNVHAIGDAWQALLLRLATAPASERAEVCQRALDLWNTPQTYAVQARLAALLARYGSDEQLRTLQAHPTFAKQPSVRIMLARHAAENAPGFNLLLRLLDDSDAGVRAQAAESIASALRAGAAPMGTAGAWIAAPARDQVSAVLANRINNDTWPMVRRAAVHAMTANCGNAASPSLRNAVAHDTDLNVQLATLEGLASCDPIAIAPLLVTVWRDAKQPTALREYAITLGATLPTLIPQLRRQLRTWRAATSDADADALRLAQKAAVELGRAGATMPVERSAIQADLLDALGDSAYPEIVAAAITGLTELGVTCTQPINAMLKKYVSSDDRMVVLAARQALTRCARATR
ncbi:MAG: hypothetical protein KBG15_10810 [Kofleriaceae bacterium]|nr:hypothetical protein [Kofleriaceae bacterium]